MNKELADKILENETSHGNELSQEAKLVVAEARGWLEGRAEARKEISICDCHTWPTIEEMHDYCVAIEKKMAEKEDPWKRMVERMLKALSEVPRLSQGPSRDLWDDVMTHVLFMKREAEKFLKDHPTL